METGLALCLAVMPLTTHAAMLVAVGTERKKQARQSYRDRQRQTGIVVPMSLPRGGGLGFVGRF
jgi:hypothetical protein